MQASNVPFVTVGENDRTIRLANTLRERIYLAARAYFSLPSAGNGRWRWRPYTSDMRKIAGTLLVSFALAASGFAQQKYVSIIGTVQSIDSGGKSFSLKTDKGESQTLKFDDRTQFLRLPAGETDTKKATRAAAGDLGSGDRAIARLKQEDQNAPAVFLYFTKQADLAQRQQKTLDDWATQSVNGTVKSVDQATKHLVMSARVGPGPARDITLDATGNVEYLRFSLDSGKYEPSTAGMAPVQVGDQIRVLGQKNADQSEIKLEALMSATFKSLPVQVKAVDAAAKTISATDLVTKKPLTIDVKSDTLLKRLDDATALQMARRLNPSFQQETGRGGRGGGRGGEAGAAPAGGQAPPERVQAGDFGGGRGGPGAGGRGGFGGGRGGRSTDPNAALLQQPSIELADLKPGESVVVTGGPSADMTKLTALSVVAGVEPILRAAPQNGPDPLGGNWNFGEGGGGGGAQ